MTTQTETTPMNAYKFDPKIHAHTLDGVPLIGTSSVLSIIAKPLTYWAAGLAVKEFGVPDPKVLTKIKNKKATKEDQVQLFDAAAHRLTEIRAMNTTDYVALLDRAYRAHATNLKETADEGTDLHLQLSNFVRFKMGVWSEVEKWTHGKTWNPRIEPFIRWTDANVERFLWSEVHVFSRRWMLGGISDCGFIDKQGRMGILDFKSAKQAYWGAFVQCAGYDIQITENGGFDADGNQTLDLIPQIRDGFDYYAVLPFGMEQPQVQVNHDTQACRENFLHALALYQAQPKD